MRSLRTLLYLFAGLSVFVSIAQAKTDFAYVANIGANTVSVIDTTTDAVVKTIPVGDGPWGVAVNQAGTYAYVVNNHDTASGDSVSVISTATNAVVATIKVGSVPFGIAFAPSGKTAYVANGKSNSVSVINTSTKTVTATVAVQSDPVGLAVMPNGTYVYVANDVSGSVSVISTLTNKVVATIPVGSNPISVAISPDGSTAYVTNSGSNTISMIQTASNHVVNTINVSAGPFGAAVSPDGHWLYVANSKGNTGDLVTVIDTASQTIKSTVVAGTGPEWVAFSEDSAFAYVTNITSHNVTLINTASATVANTIAVGPAPIGVSVMGTVKVSTVAGGYVGNTGKATNAAIGGPYSSVLDSAGNLYISEFLMNRIRKVDAAGNITTYAGTGICGYNGDGINASQAMVCVPNQLLVDSAGNMILADGGNSRIRKIDHSTGVIITIAGNGVFGYTGDGGPALRAEIGQPYAMTYDTSGNLFFAQVGNCVVRRVDTSGNILTVAGNGTCGFSGDKGLATKAQLNLPRGVAVDGSNNVYIGDSMNHRVRKVDRSGIITTFARNGHRGASGDGGPATSAAVGNPNGLEVLNGVLYIANGGSSRVRMVNLSTQIINTYAGSSYGYDGDGNALLATRFTGPKSLEFDTSGNAIFNDGFNGRVRRATAGIVSTYAGGFIGAEGASATSAALVFPEALAVDAAGNLYIADEEGNRVRKVSGGKISTIAGNGINGYSGDGGRGTSAMINEPFGVAVDSAGNVFISDSFNNVIRKVNTSGIITTFAANGNFGYLAQMATDGANNLYVADKGSCVVWKITPSGVVSIAAGVLFTCGYNGDGISATTADLNFPYGVALDGGGNLYIADNANGRLREVNTSGIISTVAGNGTCGYTGDGGSAMAAEVCPNSVAVDKAGTIYIADFNFERIRKVSGGTITTFAGVGFGFNGDGLWPLYTAFDDPVAVAVDSKGTVYVLDDWDHRVRKIQ
jgi:YVTN family beta-propeller protein